MDQRLQQRPLCDETGGHRERGSAEGADPEGQRRPGHAGGQASEQVEVAFTGGVQHGAGAEEEDGLERGMADGQQQGCDEGDVGHCELRGVPQQQSHPDRRGDQADVLRRGVREQLLQVGLHRRLQDAVEG